MKQRSPEQLNRPSLHAYKGEPKMPVCLVLDNVRSGLNVGAIFRTCDAFPVERIYLCGISAQPPHAEIMKTALGATESVAWTYKERTTDALDELESMGYQLWPVEQTDKAVLLDDFRLEEAIPIALILGNEMRGVQPEVLQRCKVSLEVPQEGTKHSLNVATTAGIVLWEFFRQYRLRRLESGL